MRHRDVIEKVNHIIKNKSTHSGETWVVELNKEEPIVISAVLGRMHTEEDYFEPKTLPARIDATKALLETKLIENLIFTMEKLDESASRLQTIGLILSVVIGLAAIGISLLLKISI